MGSVIRYQMIEVQGKFVLIFLSRLLYTYFIGMEVINFKVLFLEKGDAAR
jgi:hypothetical protein